VNSTRQIRKNLLRPSRFGEEAGPADVEVEVHVHDAGAAEKGTLDGAANRTAVDAGTNGRVVDVIGVGD